MRQVKKDKRRGDWLKNLETKYEGHKPRDKIQGKEKGDKGRNARDRGKITIYAPMIYTAPCVRFLMRADTVGAQDLGYTYAYMMYSYGVE